MSTEKGGMMDQLDFKQIVNSLSEFNRELAYSRQNPTKDASEELLTVAAAAAFLKIHRTTLYNWTKKGVIPRYGINSKVYYKKSDLLSSLVLLNN
jgi:excisionase family DNA binding protein